METSKDIWEIQTGCKGRSRKRLDSQVLNKPKPFVVSTAANAKIKPVIIKIPQN